jgi:hypothetical protein
MGQSVAHICRVSSSFLRRKNFYDLRLDLRFVWYNGCELGDAAMDTKSLSREEHVERVDLWKKVERFMAGWSAAEMPR